MCKSWCEAIIALVVIVVGYMVASPTWAKWTLVIAGVVLLIHSFTCKSCFIGTPEVSSKKASMPSRRK